MYTIIKGNSNTIVVDMAKKGDDKNQNENEKKLIKFQLLFILLLMKTLVLINQMIKRKEGMIIMNLQKEGCKT